MQDAAMHTMTLRLAPSDAQLLARLSAFYAPDKLRGMPFSDVLRMLIREDAARHLPAKKGKKT